LARIRAMVNTRWKLVESVRESKEKYKGEDRKESKEELKENEKEKIA